MFVKFKLQVDIWLDTKKQDVYEKFLKRLKDEILEMGLKFEDKTVLMDFETAFRNSVKKSWEGCDVSFNS